MDESLDDRLDMLSGQPEATLTQPLASESESDPHIAQSAQKGANADDAPSTIGVREEGEPTPETIEGALVSTSTPLNADESLTKDQSQLANGPPSTKKRKVAARAIISDSISDK